jgi:hypothetical protein
MHYDLRLATKAHLKAPSCIVVEEFYTPPADDMPSSVQFFPELSEAYREMSRTLTEPITIPQGITLEHELYIDQGLAVDPLEYTPITDMEPGGAIYHTRKGPIAVTEDGLVLAGYNLFG